MPYPSYTSAISGAIGTTNSADKYATHLDFLGRGGYRSVTDHTALTAITENRRSNGMLIRVHNYQSSGEKYFVYINPDYSDTTDTLNTGATNYNTVYLIGDPNYNTATRGFKEIQFGGSSLPNNTGLQTTKVYYLKNAHSGGNWSQSWSEPVISDISGLATALSGKEGIITTLPISKGGTNSNTALANSRIMISSGNAIVEHSAIAANKVLVTDSNGLPVAGIDSGTLSNIPTNTNDALNLKLNITATSVASGSNIALDFSSSDTVFGSTTPVSGSITLNITNAKLGVTHIVIHNGSSYSLVANGITAVKLTGSGNFKASVTNYIYFTFVGGSTVIYSINQAA